jgi:hypothetical protein
MPKPDKTEPVNFRCPVELLDKLKRQAEKEGRTLSNMIVRILSERKTPH